MSETERGGEAEEIGSGADDRRHVDTWRSTAVPDRHSLQTAIDDRSPPADDKIPPSSLHANSETPNLGDVWILFPVLAVLWCYATALGFAYFNDDPTGHFAWMEGQSLGQFFAGSDDYGYYRPVVFAVLRLTEHLFGNATFPHNPVADHALLLLLHMANAALVWALARRLGGGRAFATVAALLFACVPFSYEAVAYVASLTHPLVVFWTLLALLFFVRYQDARGKSRDLSSVDRRAGSNGELRFMNGGSRVGVGRSLDTGYWLQDGSYGALVASLLFLTLGLLTHENGLFIFPAIVGLDWVRRPGAGWRERARRLWPFALPPALFAVLWLAIPKNSEQGFNSLADIGRNLVPFLQTLVYPLLPIVRFDAADTLGLVILVVVVVSGLGLLAWRAGAWRVWVFALGWFVLSSLPALIFLGPTYVYGSPRLSYLPSIGIALLWALPVWWLGETTRLRPSTADRHLQPVEPAARSNRHSSFVIRHSTVGRRLSSLALTAAYTLAILLPPLPFVGCQLDFYDETSRFAREMATAAAGAPAGREVVFVNVPFFFSSTAARPDGCPSPYPWTPVGGILIPPYAQPRDFVRFNGGPDRAVTGVTYAGYAPGWRTFGPEIDGETLRNHAVEDTVYVFDLLNGSFDGLSDAWQPDAGPVTTPLATFGEALALVDSEVEAEVDRLLIRLEWRVLAGSDDPLAAFIHVYNAAGTLVAQSDGPPGHGRAPQPLWRPGDGLADERVIDLTMLPPGTYTVAVGVYDTNSGNRLLAAADGQPLIDDVFPAGMIER